MAISEDWLEYLRELLEWLPHLRVKKMFGGAGFYSDELFFAIADNDGLYLKADNESRPFYRNGGSEQFTYESKGKVGRMNFWSVPADALEDQDELRRWVDVALETALRNRK
ncbi:MAG: TfoX/Sxy family protein [Candidatus Thiodiazotropha sp.]|jgi:DNA transformation protein